MKKILMTLAAAGLMLTGCTTNEGGGYDIPDSDVISFSPTTSRAVVYDLSTLTGDNNGFRVYGLIDGGTAWYTDVNGENNYSYDESNWGWKGTPAIWPTIDTNYPMNFYAMYPATAPSTVTPGSSLTGEITIAATAATQTDLLAAKATATAKPASGKLSMTFNHILSKVNFGVIAGHDMTPQVQAIAINNIHSSNNYNYMSPGWSSQTDVIADYDYFRNVTTPFSTNGTDTEEETPVPIYTAETTPAASASNLMLMPQDQASGSPAAWEPTSGTAPGDNAYIEVIYRITHTGDGSNYIGYTNGGTYLTDHPTYVNNNTWGTYTSGLGTGAAQYNGALYIRAGFPVTVDWDPGKGYTYNICLGTADSTNGYYIDSTYYDDKGADTGVPIKFPGSETPVAPGDPVTSGVINFLVRVSNWDDTATATPLQ